MDLVIDEEGRECSCCRKFKVWALFAKQKDGTNNRSTKCKACRQEAQNLSRKPKMKDEVISDGRALDWGLVTKFLRYGFKVVV